VDQAVYEVFSDELGAMTISMLSKPDPQIVGDADIQSAVLAAREDIDRLTDCAHFALHGKNADADRWVPAFAGTTEDGAGPL
jgi:hypothetical protein